MGSIVLLLASCTSHKQLRDWNNKFDNLILKLSNMANENTHNETKKSEQGFDFKELLAKALFNWRWFVVSVLICLFCAAAYLRNKTKIYQIQATIMINDDKKGSYQNQMMALQDFGYVSSSGGIDNEIEILRSKSLIKETVLDLKLYTSYTLQEHFSKTKEVFV